MTARASGVRGSLLALAAGIGAVAAGQAAGEPLGIRDVRHWSYDGYTRVVVEVEGPVETRVRRLPANPEAERGERLYFDLPGVHVGAERLEPVPVRDGLLRQVRLGQHAPGVGRVVVDPRSLRAPSPVHADGPRPRGARRLRRSHPRRSRRASGGEAPQPHRHGDDRPRARRRRSRCERGGGPAREGAHAGGGSRAAPPAPGPGLPGGDDPRRRPQPEPGGTHGPGRGGAHRRLRLDPRERGPAPRRPRRRDLLSRREPRAPLAAGRRAGERGVARGPRPAPARHGGASAPRRSRPRRPSSPTGSTGAWSPESMPCTGPCATSA